jgi:hypothetical protein
MQTATKPRPQAVPAPDIPIPTTTSYTHDYNGQIDYAPEWDRDTDTLASYLSWKSNFNSALHHNLGMTDLLGPICQFVRNELRHQLSTHTSNVKNPGIQDLRESNKEMRHEILRLTQTVTKLTEQVAVLTARPVPTSNPTVIRTVVSPQQLHQKPPTTMKPPPVSKPTYAQVAERTKEEFTEVKSKKQTKRETLLPKPYPTADRLVIFNLTTAPNDCKEAADRALQLVNKTITSHNDITHPPFILAKITAANNLVFTVGPQHLSTNYEPYLGILEDALHEFPIASSRISQRWSRFIIHGIPTTADPDTVRTEIESTYPILRMGQTPRWLTRPERRQGKETSSMVITLIGEITKKSLGAESLAVFNRECKIAEYITFGPSTRCNKCQLYGHPTQRCTADGYTCAVCAQLHATKDHPCTIANCKAGHSCNHPPIRCSNCQQPHKASDRNCPTYVRIALALRRDTTAAAPDTTMTAE